MTFLELMQVVLPLLLYLAGFILLIILIILCSKLLKTMNKVDRIVDNVDKKVKSLDGIFGLIDFCTDKITLFTNKLVDKLSNIVIGKKKNKYNNEEEDINE